MRFTEERQGTNAAQLSEPSMNSVFRELSARVVHCHKNVGERLQHGTLRIYVFLFAHCHEQRIGYGSVG